MVSLDMTQGALVTRDAYSAMLDLKKLVDGAVEKSRRAEVEAVGLAIGRSRGNDALGPLQMAVDTLRSPDFEAAVAGARTKMETAVAWHLKTQNQ
jgi:hypothetical protein